MLVPQPVLQDVFIFTLQGAKIIQSFMWYLNPRQVFDLSQGGPKEGYLFSIYCTLYAQRVTGTYCISAAYSYSCFPLQLRIVPQSAQPADFSLWWRWHSKYMLDCCLLCACLQLIL